ncbi:MAG TPA: peptide ligase PGM1-related protein [Candidatus Eisenbacteria bacterium]|nr:peptide ligase PGM1-related protein [Candidatus Eisenbacteria bacterium]
MASDSYDDLERRLGPALEANRPGSAVEHVLIALPSYSVSESLISHYGNRIPSLEHRYLTATLIPSRIVTCSLVYISTLRPAPEVIDYYLSVVPPENRERLRDRVSYIEVDDGTPHSVASKLLDQPRVIDELRAAIGDRPALIEPWNVTDNEVALALALNVPINGTRPELRPIAFKSAGRRLLVEAGVPVPLGREDVRSVDDVVDAVIAIRAEHPRAPGVVIKHDDSGAGDGNVVVDLDGLDDAADPRAWLRSRIEALPDWYLEDLAKGGVVEERIAGTRFTSPSAQVDIRPSGEVVVLATHEQVLGGPGGQVYLGCRFPADPAYAPALARHATAAGQALARLGALGRFSVDFVAAADDASEWRIHGLEINLRKGGTTHPYAALRNLVPGRYATEEGRWVAADGSSRAYSATDNLMDPAWKGLPVAAVIAAVAEAGLQFDARTGVGVVLHMLSGLAIDGRMGVIAIARTPEGAEALQTSAAAAVNQLAAAAPA